MFNDIVNVCLDDSQLTDHPQIPPILDMADHLLSVDTFTDVRADEQVDNDPVGTVSQIVTSFLHAVVYKMGKKHDLEFLLIPCGSAHVGNKVDKFDEMDFILVWNVGEVTIQSTGHDHIYDVTYSAKHPYLLHNDLKEFLFRAVAGIIQRLRGNLKVLSVSIDGVMPHRKSPGIYMQIAWSCVRGHTHDVSIDLTPVIILPGKRLGDIWTWNIPQAKAMEYSSAFTDILNRLQDAPVALVPYKGTLVPDEDSETVTSQWRLSMNVCDWKLFRMLDEISPNIRKAYRLLKVIRNEVCPREFKSRKLQYDFIFNLDHRYFLKESQLVSSHVLESIILEEVERCPENRYWIGRVFFKETCVLFVFYREKPLQIYTYRKLSRNTSNRYIRQSYQSCVV